ncbi:hypothetical protein ACL02T_02315 [Pseudonocardia sp. RS010]|uniref:hypothetical protein n=1 Tax=Pseudonocardia sp. RS010 TaxID=3385979 RepID=UPI0039A2BD58
MTTPDPDPVPTFHRDRVDRMDHQDPRDREDETPAGSEDEPAEERSQEGGPDSGTSGEWREGASG